MLGARAKLPGVCGRRGQVRMRLQWRRRKEPCKHIFAALVWAAKARRALVLAGRGAA